MYNLRFSRATDPSIIDRMGAREATDSNAKSNSPAILKSRLRHFCGALTILLTISSILAISSGIAGPTNNKQLSKRSEPQVPSAVDEVSAGCTLTEGFDSVDTLVGNGWFMQNNSMPAGNTGWSQGNPAIFTSQLGPSNSYVDADFNNGSGAATISN